jgi:hypothetical protein
MTNILQLVRAALQALRSLAAYIMEAENRKVSLMVISTFQSIEYYVGREELTHEELK